MRRIPPLIVILPVLIGPGRALADCTVTDLTSLARSDPDYQECSPFTSAIDPSYAATCHVLRITCDDENTPYSDEGDILVELLFADPGVTAKGAVVLGGGAGGTDFYETLGESIATELLVPLLEDGYWIIQRKWLAPWPGGVGGMRSVSRRGTAMFGWLKGLDGEPGEPGGINLNGVPLCATGNSGGAVEIAYGLAYHGLTATLDGAVLTSGPPLSDLQKACWGDDITVFDPPWYAPNVAADENTPSQVDAHIWNPDGLCFDDGPEGYGGNGFQFEFTFDLPDNDPPFFFEWYEGILRPQNQDSVNGTYGQPPTDGICQVTNPSELERNRLCDDSLACDDWVDQDEFPAYDYPATKVAFLFGNEDCGVAIPFGLVYATVVTHVGGMAASITFVDGGGHRLATTPSGADAIAEALRYTCNRCEGDANGDGTVDPLDSGFVLARFGCPLGTGDPSCDAADQNGDGAVDPLDSGFVLARFGECP